MNVRRARVADLDAVLAIEAAHRTTPHWTRRQFQAEIENPASLFLVVDDSAAVAGYAVLWVVPPEAQLLNVAVAPLSQRKGVGKAILKELIVRCEALNYRQLIAVIGDSANAASIAVHASLGFVRAGNLRSTGYKFGRWVDSVYMQLPLGTGDGTKP